MKVLTKVMFVMLTVFLGVLLTAFEVGAQAQSTEPATEEATPISDAAAQQFAAQFNSIFDGPSLDVIDQIFAPGYVGHLPLAPALDREGLKAYIGSFYSGMSDLKEEVNEVIVSKDRVVLRVTYSGTNDGTLFGIPATGKHVSIDGVGIFRFDENGKVAENWAVIDVVGLLAQIGAFPPTQQPAS